jgi:hypothetical protein
MRQVVIPAAVHRASDAADALVIKLNATDITATRRAMGPNFP